MAAAWANVRGLCLFLRSTGRQSEGKQRASRDLERHDLKWDSAVSAGVVEKKGGRECGGSILYVTGGRSLGLVRGEMLC